MKIKSFFRNKNGIKVIIVLCLIFLSFGHNAVAILTIPTVTINQKSGQSDPSLTQTVIFRVVFSSTINISTFTTSDIDTSGSTAFGVSVDTITEVAPFNGKNFDVSISALGSGAIIVTIPPTVFTHTSAIFGTTGSSPYDIVFDGLDNLYAVNFGSNNVTKITPDGITSVLGTTGSFPSDITIDDIGNIYTADYGSDTVTKITPGGVSTTLGTTGVNPVAITIDGDGNIYTANSDSNNVTKITPGGVSTILGTTELVPVAITIDEDGNIYTANSDSNNVTKITPGGVSTILGTTGSLPQAITIDGNGNIYTANTDSNNVTKITPGGVSTIFATTGLNPSGITVDGHENIYTTNTGSNNVTKITPGGVSTTLGTTGSNPSGITIDSTGRNIYTANSVSDNVTKFLASPVGTGGVFTQTGSTISASTSTDNSITFAPASGGANILSSPPQIPEGGFEVKINNGTTSTLSKNVTLSFNAGSDVARVAISNSTDLTNSIQESYTSSKTWDLCSTNGFPTILGCSNGQKNVYVKFYTASGHPSAIVMGTIYLSSTENQSIQNELNTSAQPLEFINSSNERMYNKLKGTILLKIEDAGKAYYVHPLNKNIYYLGRPSNAFAVIRQQGVGITNTNLQKIPVGIGPVNGLDQDSDGLGDLLEDALGIDKNNVDTDGDGYADKIELENNYNPLGSGKQQYDFKFAEKLRGYIFLQVEGKGEAWYINPRDNKRYFLGRVNDAFSMMKNMSLGILNQDFDSLF